MFEINNTPEQISKNYSASMDSVNLINRPKPEEFTAEEWAIILTANKDHLKIMLGKNYWTTEDLTPLKNAVK